MNNFTHEAPSPREETLKFLRTFARAYRPTPRKNTLSCPNIQAALPQMSKTLPC